MFHLCEPGKLRAAAVLLLVGTSVAYVLWNKACLSLRAKCEQFLFSTGEVQTYTAVVSALGCAVALVAALG